MHIWSLLGEIQCWYLFICCCLSSLLFLCFVIFPLRENRLVLCLLDIFERSLQKFAGSRNEIQNRLNRSSGTALTSMLYNKVGVFFKVFADDCNNFLYNVCDDSLSGTWYTAGSSSGGRERERETFHQISLQVWIFCICSKLHYTWQMLNGSLSLLPHWMLLSRW